MRVGIAFSLLAAGLLAAACTTTTEQHQLARAEAASTLRKSAAVDYTVAEAAGRQAAAWGDTWTATNLFERAVDKHNTITGRFNLAAGYQRTGRLAEAAALYSGLVRDGQFVWLTGSTDYNNPERRLTHFNVADESARQLAVIRNQMAYAAASRSGGAVAAGEFGTPVAAVVGGPVGATARVSDADAMARDAAANPLG